ncbi:MAG TPA: calcium/sodium antiporter [Woeseiaceae bacterium]
MFMFAGLILGIVLLIAGGGLLVRGASEIAAKFGVSPMIVGLTIVGFGTSAPELVVNVVSALRGETALAFGNVVGSNIANVGLILGIAAVLAPITIQGQIVRREVPFLLLVTTILTVMVLDKPLEGLPGLIGRTEAVVLVLLFCIFLYMSAIDVLQDRRSDPLMLDIEDNPLTKPPEEGRWQWLLVAAGLVLLFVGGEMTVRNGVALASALGVSANIIGLVLVAVGTSMPELVTSIIAALRRESDLALGNVVGSNLFNSLIVLPISGLIRPIPLPPGGVIDLVVSWGFVALLIPFFYIGEARLDRKVGGFLLLAYAAYMASRFMFDQP